MHHTIFALISCVFFLLVFISRLELSPSRFKFHLSHTFQTRTRNGLFYKGVNVTPTFTLTHTHTHTHTLVFAHLLTSDYKLEHLIRL